MGSDSYHLGSMMLESEDYAPDVDRSRAKDYRLLTEILCLLFGIILFPVRNSTITLFLVHAPG